MADAILGSVIQVAQAIYAIIQGNIAVGEEEKELGEFCQLITSSLSGVDGEQASNFKDPLSTMLHYLEEAKGLCEHLHKRKGLQKAFEMLNPQAMLDKLAGCQAKLLKVNQILGVAFSADAAKKQQESAREEFDAVAVINHVSAKTFWRKQFGSKEYEVKWTRLKGAFQREYKADLPGMLTEDNFKVLKDRLDGDGDGSISVYDFAEFTDDFGLLKAFLRAVKPESALEKLPESKGSASELLKRTIFIDGALMFDVQDVGPIRNALEESAGGGIFKCIKFESGVLVEFVTVEHITQMLEVDLSKKKKMERKLKIDWAKCTVDEVWQKLWDAEEEKKRKLEEGGKGMKAEDAQAVVSLELKLLQEEQAQKVQEHQDEHKEKMAAVEKEARAAALAKAGGGGADGKDAKLTPEQQAAIDAEIQKEVERKKTELAKEFADTERKLEEQRQKETNKLKNKYANLKFLTDIFAPSKEKIQNDFMDYFQDNKDETVIEYYQCSINRREYFGDVPRVGNMYITEFGLYFYSSVFGSETREIMRFGEITTMEKRKYLAFPTALGFHVIFDNDPDDKRDLEFVTFVDRNAAFSKIEEVWDTFVKKNGGTLVAAGDRVTFEKNFVIKKEGKLQKKGAVVQNWKERWFVLSEHTFTYAKKKGDPIIRAIPLAKVGDCRIDEKNRKLFLFHVITKERTFECKAKNAKEMEEWVDKIKDCLAALRLSFYYGVIIQGKNVYQPMWRVLELNFTMKCVRLMNQGRVVVQVPFEQVHRTDRDHENPMVFYIFMKSGMRHHYICQTGEDREAIVDILERITKRGNKMVEELLRLRKQIFSKEKEKSIAAASSPANGSAKDQKVSASDVKSPKDGDVKRLDEAQKAIQQLERSLHIEAGNVIDDLRNQQAVVIRRGALSRVSTVFNDKRYCILENRDEGARLTVYQSDISVIPLDIIALKNCTLLQDNEYRFAIFSSMTDRPWHFEAETPAIRAEWMTSLLFSMYPLPVGQSALAMDNAPNTTGGGIGMFSTLGSPTAAEPRQSAMQIALNAPPALVIANSNTAGAGGGRQRGYTGVGQPPPYNRETVVEGEKEGYPSQSQREGKSSVPVPSLARPSSVTPMSASGALVEKENEILQLKLKLAEALKKFDGAVKDRDVYQTEARENDRKLLIMKDNFDIAQAGLFGLFVRQGAMLLKHQKSGSPNPRFVFLSDNAQAVCWAENNTEKQRKKAKEIKSNGVKELRKGIASDAFVKPKYITDAQAKLCFTIVGADRTLDFQCDSEEQRDMWVEALAKVIGKALRKPVPITTGAGAAAAAGGGGGAASPPGSPSVASPASDPRTPGSS